MNAPLQEFKNDNNEQTNNKKPFNNKYILIQIVNTFKSISARPRHKIEN